MLGGALTAAIGIAWVLVSPWDEAGTAVPIEVALRLGAAGLGGLLMALILAWWLDHGIVGRVRRLASAARGSASPSALPAGFEPLTASGWGELADLARHLDSLLGRYRQSARASEELQQLEAQLESTRATIERWVDTERWIPLAPGAGVHQELSSALNRSVHRQAEVNDQNREAARQVHADLVDAVGDARESAEQAERGFVEATSLLTTARELERLGSELHQALAVRSAPPDPDRAGGMQLEPLVDAVQELVDAATAGIEPLGTALDRVHEISDQVHVLANRATLIALNAMLAARQGATGAEGSVDDLRPLAREARVATDRVQALAHELDRHVKAASERVRGVRERVADRLARLEAPRASEPRGIALGADTLRSLERVREMIQDATRKAERLSAAGERASRAADRLVRRLDEEVRDLEGIVVRLLPPTNAEQRPAERHEAATRRLSVVELAEHADESADAGAARKTQSRNDEERS